MERLKLPWIKEEAPETAPNAILEKLYKSQFAFIGLVRNKNKGYLAIVLRQLTMEEGQEKPIDFELIFEHRLRNHPVELAKLVRFYFE